MFLEIASWAYPNYQLSFSDVLVDIDPNFNNLGWRIDDITSHTKVETYWDLYDYTFAVYDLTITRYSSYYIRSAVLPCLVSSLIVLFGLWVENIASRLSLSITGLLTNIAVQVCTNYHDILFISWILLIFTSMYSGLWLQNYQSQMVRCG